MAKEHKIGETNIEALEAEINKAKRFVDLGMYKEINRKNFPQLASVYPNRIVDFQVQAVQQAYTEKSKARGFVSPNSDAFTRISREMGRLAKKAVGLVKKGYKEGGQKGSEVQPIFWMNGDEAAALELAIRRGLPEVINAVNLPSLAAVSKRHIQRLRLQALMADEEEWDTIGNKAKDGVGLIQHGGDSMVQMVVYTAKKEIDKARAGIARA